MKNNPSYDKILATKFKELPKAPPSPWFTRKVMNRLPERKQRIASTIELSVYFIGIIVDLLFLVKYSATAMDASITTHHPLDDSFIILYVLIFLMFALLYMFISPFVYRYVH